MEDDTAAKLRGSLKREIKVYGIEGPVVLEISDEGISFVAKGSRVHVRASWSQAVNSCGTPTNVQSFLFGHPLDLLKSEADKQVRKAVKKAEQQQHFRRS